MCRNLIKYQRIIPKKIIKTAGGASQYTNHGLIGGEKPGEKCSSITVEEHDENLPLLSKCCQTLFRL